MTQTSSRHRISSYLSIGLGLCQYKISTGKKVSPSGDRPIIFMYDASRQPQHQTDIVFIFDFQCSFASSQQKLLRCTACIPRQDLRFCNRSNPPMSDVFGWPHILLSILYKDPISGLRKPDCHPFLHIFLNLSKWHFTVPPVPWFTDFQISCSFGPDPCGKRFFIRQILF